MSDDTRGEAGAPPPFLVYYNPTVHLIKLVAILAICAVLALLPFWVDGIRSDAVLVLAGFIGVFLIWAYLTASRMRDQRPQVVVDTAGIYVRDWHVDIVPWEQIDFIAHSSSVRRGIVSALTRSRRGPYLLFKFEQMPRFVSSMPPPFSWLQKLWVDIELQEPALMEYGLNAKASVILQAIQEHIAYWQKTHNSGGEDATVVAPGR